MASVLEIEGRDACCTCTYVGRGRPGRRGAEGSAIRGHGSASEDRARGALLRPRRSRAPISSVRPSGRASYGSIRRSSGCSTPTGARRTTSPSGRSTCSTTRCCASRSQPEHVKPRLLGHFGTTPGLNLVYAHLNRAIRARDLNAIFVTGPGHGGPGDRRERLPRGHVHASSTRTSAATRTACASSSASSRSPAASRATSRPRRRARSTRAASSATRSRTPSAPRSTTPICSSAASSATARRRPGRSRRAGTRTSS